MDRLRHRHIQTLLYMYINTHFSRRYFNKLKHIYWYKHLLLLNTLYIYIAKRNVKKKTRFFNISWQKSHKFKITPR